jgi:hypothetical protein
MWRLAGPVIDGYGHRIALAGPHYPRGRAGLHDGHHFTAVNSLHLVGFAAVGLGPLLKEAALLRRLAPFADDDNFAGWLSQGGGSLVDTFQMPVGFIQLRIHLTDLLVRIAR